MMLENIYISNYLFIWSNYFSSKNYTLHKLSLSHLFSKSTPTSSIVTFPYLFKENWTISFTKSIKVFVWIRKVPFRVKSKWRHESQAYANSIQSVDNNDFDAWTTSYWTNFTVVIESPPPSPPSCQL